MAAMPGGTGAYSDSRGAMVLRKDIAKVCWLLNATLFINFYPGD